MVKFIITGPESSGKTTLAKKLSEIYDIGLIEEYARKYLNENENKYGFDDLLKIAHKQYENEKNCKQFCICDTDLITIKIWSNYKYSKCDSWIEEKIFKQSHEKRIYLLCKPDIKWEYDPQRENKKNRNEIFDIYEKEITKLNYPFFIIDGEKRLSKAQKIIKKFFK